MKLPTKESERFWIALGNHQNIIQSSLDYDYLVGRDNPSLLAVVGVKQKACRYFFGSKEITIPGYLSIADIPSDIRKKASLFGVMHSGRRVLQSVNDVVRSCNNLLAGFIFAEGVTERDALQLRELSSNNDLLLVGPASVGILVGGAFKLGAIGGTMPDQIARTYSMDKGDTAIISTSGGIINEIINTLASNGGRVGFAAAVGGERYPTTKPSKLIALALQSPSITNIIYFGELGGEDEYEIAQLYKDSNNSKRLVSYIAGTIAEQFDTPQQFGHAKAMAHSNRETSTAKKQALKQVGIEVYNTFGEFEKAIASLGAGTNPNPQDVNDLINRKSALFLDRVSREDNDGTVKILNSDLLEFTQSRTLSDIILQMYLGRTKVSNELSDFFDTTLRLLVDHGPQVSGAVNTMITARAGKDLVSALAAGLLTIGPRFGGAINQAAFYWFEAVQSGESPGSFVERFAVRKEYIPGIGHKKYRLDTPDPRVIYLLKKYDNKVFKYTSFAKKVEKITTSKKAQLILNVDGLVAALLLDILENHEKLKNQDIHSLLQTEFCNALFVTARSIGFTAHYLEQKRLDEGLFRLPNDDIVS